MTYSDPSADEQRGVIHFKIVSSSSVVEAEFSFELLERLANEREGCALDTADDHLEFAKRWQPELKDAALRLAESTDTVAMTSADITEIRLP
ncbi:hypothetical protein [Sphingosinicella sp. LY1275]|uniref:hypothetical protein n=1 Tax=Sphingosinicella sp. LY1275 TaxID=3095379 RepID=UPI002ADED106|nr:hypothetical protein [Sphingosinicella sp. LY1275]MEA1015586.1 hypothetical protein [Sphingosinicella sp. LY1275]